VAGSAVHRGSICSSCRDACNYQRIYHRHYSLRITHSVVITSANLHNPDTPSSTLQVTCATRSLSLPRSRCSCGGISFASVAIALSAGTSFLKQYSNVGIAPKRCSDMLVRMALTFRQWMRSKSSRKRGGQWILGKIFPDARQMCPQARIGMQGP
jgi:hypothetical protein